MNKLYLKFDKPEDGQLLKTGFFSINKAGFTLIEMISVIVILSIVGTMLVTTLGKGLTQSVTPLTRVGDQYRLIQQMEILTSRYRQALNAGTLNLTDFYNTNVNSGCTTCILYVESAKSGILPASLTSPATSPHAAAYSTQNQILRVTLKYGDLSIQSYFTAP